MDWQNVLLVGNKFSAKSELTLENLNSLLFLIESIKGDLDLDKIFFNIGDHLKNLGVSVHIAILDKQDNVVLRHYSSSDEKIKTFQKIVFKDSQRTTISFEDYFLNINKELLFDKRAIFEKSRIKKLAEKFSYSQPGLFSQYKSVIVPMMLRDETIGFIEFFSEEIEKEEVEIYNYFTRNFVKSIANLILYREAKESEHRYRDIFENASEGFAIIDINKNIFLEVNNALIKLSGYTKEELRQMNAMLLFPLEERGRVNIFIKEFMAREFKKISTINFETKLITKNKEIKYVGIKFAEIIKQNELFLIIDDESEQRLASEKIKLAKTHYESVIDTINDGICVVGKNMKIISFNRKFIDKVRLPVNKIKHAHCSTIIPRYDENKMGKLCGCQGHSDTCHILEVFKEKKLKVINKKIPSKDFTKYYTVRLYPSINEDGDVYQVVIIISDVTKDKMVEMEIKELHMFQKMILDNIPVSIIVLDIEGKVVSLNMYAERLIEKKIIDQRLIDLGEIKKSKKLVEKYENLIKDGEPFFHENLNYINAKTKEEKCLDLIAVPMFDFNKKIKGAISMALDNTEEVKSKLAIRELNKDLENKILQRTKELDEANKRLNNALELKSNFISDASHELRTPLTIIQGNLELAEREAEYNKAEVPELYDILQHEVNQISGILSDLTMLTNADSGAEKTMFEKVDLKKIVVASVESLKILANKKKISIKILNGTKKCIILGDEAKLERMFLNILRNAIKYTDENGNIMVGIKINEKDAVVSIEDNGIGIPEKDLPNIFERFYRVDKARSRDEGGTGLGLSICKWIADTHNGKITVESEEDKSTTFYVSLPLDSSELAKKMN